jgi:hypothetical protein
MPSQRQELIFGACKILLSGVLTFCLVAAPSWGADDFLISYWLGPEPSDSSFAQIAAANFNVAPTGGGRKVLDLAQKHGLKVLIQDGRITAKSAHEKDFQKNLDAVLADYADHPALWGYYITDEPNASQFADLGAINQYLLRKDPKHVPFINLFPTYASAQQLGNPTYEDHVTSFLRIVKPKVLSYDHYALLQNGLRPDYFENLEIVRREGLKHEVPFAFVLLSIPHFSYRNPSESDLRWQVNTALAYGARGIVYFTYMTPPPTKEYEGWRDAIVSPEGKPNAKYKQVQKINGELKQLGPTLMQLTSTAVYHTSPAPRGASLLPAGDRVARIEDAEMVIGHFRSSQGEPYTIFVNRNPQKAAEATIVLSTELSFQQVEPPPGQSDAAAIRREGGKTIWKVHFEPGQRRLLKFVENR